MKPELHLMRPRVQLLRVLDGVCFNQQLIVVLLHATNVFSLDCFHAWCSFLLVPDGPDAGAVCSVL